MVMRARLLAAYGIGVAALAAGCASILSIPDRSPEWCDRPENKHGFCDDFDHDDAGGAWLPGSTPGTTLLFSSSSDTQPNALDLKTAPQPLGGVAVAGLYHSFPSTQRFDHVHFAVDVRFLSLDLATEGGLSSELGFLLLAQQDFCIGTVMTPAGIGIVMRAHSTDCTGVTDVPADASDIRDDAGLTGFALVSPVPNLNQWYHVSLDVKRNSDGSGALGFDLDYPGVITPPQIPPGYLTAASPAVAIATSIVGPSGHVELQFDNVTVDFGN
jgi:hypothetical protein